MATYLIKDDCLGPERFIYLDYSGADPFGVTKKIGSMLNKYFHVSTSGVSEYDFRWDKSGDPTGFFVRWWIKKDMSGYSTAWFYIQVQGNKARETNEGDFRLEVSAELKTKFGFRNPFLRGLWGIYSYLFYNKRRRSYIRTCSDMAHGLRDELKTHYNLRVKGERGEH